MQRIQDCDLECVVGGINIGGVEQGDDGRSNFRMDSIPAGTTTMGNPSRPTAAQQGIANYNKFYDNYTGLIDNLNGIGGGAAVAGGAKPTPDIGF
jgi:hypothetical protein